MRNNPVFVTLPSGLRIASIHTPTEPDLVISAHVAVGNYHFPEHLSGLPHLVEHLVFSGTTTRSMEEIREVQNIPLGWQHAYTDYEATRYSAGAKADRRMKNFDMVADVLSDTLQNSVCPEERLSHEKWVAVNEMWEAAEKPSERLRAETLAATFVDQAQGRNIMGTEENVLSFTRADCLSVLEKYSADRMVVVASGNHPAHEMAQVLSDKFGSIAKRPVVADVQPFQMTSGFHDGGSTSFLHQNHFMAVLPVHIGYGSTDHVLPYFIKDVLNKRFSDSRDYHSFTYGATCSLNGEQGQSYIVIEGCTRPHTSDDLLKEMAAQIAAIKQGITTEEMRRLRKERIIETRNIHNNPAAFHDRIVDELSLRNAPFCQETELKFWESRKDDELIQSARAAFTDEVSLGYMGHRDGFMHFDNFYELCEKGSSGRISLKKPFATPALAICS